MNELEKFAKDLQNVTRWHTLNGLRICPECSSFVPNTTEAMHKHGQWHVSHAREHGLGETNE